MNEIMNEIMYLPTLIIVLAIALVLMGIGFGLGWHCRGSQVRKLQGEKVRMESKVIRMGRKIKTQTELIQKMMQESVNERKCKQRNDEILAAQKKLMKQTPSSPNFVAVMKDDDIQNSD